MTKSKFLLIALIVFSAGLPMLVPSWHGKLLIALVVIWIFSGIRKNFFKEFPGQKSVPFIFSGFIIISLLGIIYSNNWKAGISYIETLAPLVVLPIVLFCLSIQNDFRKILIAFVAGVITLNLASLFFISYDLWDPINLQSNIILANNAIVKIHPVFLSLYISFCIFFLIDQFFPIDMANRQSMGWVLFSLVILVVYLIWINSRTGIFVFFVGALYYSFYKFRRRQRVLSFSLLLLILILIFTIPFSRERFLNAPLRVFQGEVSTITNDRNTYTLIARKQILDCSIELLKGPELFYGYGTGDFRDEIRKCYQEKGYTFAYQENLDSHNEYFAQLHRHGVIGLILFAMLLGIPFRYALKYSSPLLAVFIILFALTAMFENVFSAQKGVTFFALICPLLMLLAKQQSKPKVVEETSS